MAEEAIRSLIQCDLVLCNDITSRLATAETAFLREFHPSEYKKYLMCKAERPDSRATSSDPCEKMLSESRLAVSAEFKAACNRIRSVTPGNGMKEYKLENYLSPFWFTTLGNAWKRAANGASVNASEACAPLEAAAAACPHDPTASNARCRELAHRASVCRAGVNCPTKQLPFLQCVFQADAVQGESLQSGAEAYKTLTTCLAEVDEFPKCNS